MLAVRLNGEKCIVYKGTASGLLASETMAFHFFHVKSTLNVELLEEVCMYCGVSDEAILFESTAVNGSVKVEEVLMG